MQEGSLDTYAEARVHFKRVCLALSGDGGGSGGGVGVRRPSTASCGGQ